MKLRALVFAAALAVSATSSDQVANVLQYENDVYPDGSYKYGFETSNGIITQARGTPSDFGGNPPVAPVVSQGSFSWTSPEGQLVDIIYIADENGYQPFGDAIPTPPTPADLETSTGRPSSGNNKPKNEYVPTYRPPPSEIRKSILSGLPSSSRNKKA